MTEPLLDRDFWLERSEWPIGNGGWTFLGDAFDDVGRALAGDDWSGSEVTTYRSNVPARALLEKTMEWIAGRCRDGDIRTAIQRSWEVEISDYSQPIWNIRPAARRFYRCGFHPGSPLSRFDAESRFAYIFLNQEDLSKRIAGLPHAGAVVTAVDLSTYSDHLQFAVGLAKRWNFNRDYKPRKRDSLTIDIRDAWTATRQSTLSPEAAERIGFILKGFEKD